MRGPTFAVVLSTEERACPSCGVPVDTETLRYYSRRDDGSLVSGILTGLESHRAPCGLLCAMSPAPTAEAPLTWQLHVGGSCRLCYAPPLTGIHPL